jgi:hypothetical protein
MLGSCLLPDVQRCTRFSLRLVASCCMILGCPRIFGSQSFIRGPDSIEAPVFNRGDQGRELSRNDDGKLRYQIEENHSGARLSSLGQHPPPINPTAEDDIIPDEMFGCSARQQQSAANCRLISHRSLLIEILPATPTDHTAPSTKLGASPVMGNTRSVEGSIYRLSEMIWKQLVGNTRSVERSIYRLSETVWKQLGLGERCFSFEAVDHEFEPVCQGEARPPPGQELAALAPRE